MQQHSWLKSLLSMNIYHHIVPISFLIYYILHRKATVKSVESSKVMHALHMSFNLSDFIIRIQNEGSLLILTECLNLKHKPSKSYIQTPIYLLLIYLVISSYIYFSLSFTKNQYHSNVSCKIIVWYFQ